MRERADEERIRRFLHELGKGVRRPGRVYLTGASTAVIEGWRTSTVAVDVRFKPEDDAPLRLLPALKERLDLNVELASPPDFIPELPAWRKRSPFVLRAGRLDVHHFDPYSQALSKIERGFDQDLEDVGAMLARGLIRREQALELFARIQPDLYRYPAIDPASFATRVRRTLAAG